MKKFRRAFILIFCLVIKLVGAQDLSVFQRHNGIIIKRKLAIEYNESKRKFLYFKDNQDNLELNTHDLFNIKGTDNGKYVIAIKFYNPLRVKFNFEETKVEDPAIAAINTFISKIPVDILDLKVKSEGPSLGSDPKDYFYNFDSQINYSPSEGASSTLKMDLPSSIVLSQWIYEFGKVVKDTVANKETSKLRQLISDIGRIENVDKYLYGEIEIDEGKARSLNDWMLKIQDDMYDQITRDDFENELEQTKKVYKKLNEAKLLAEESMKFFFDLATNKFDERIAPYLKDSKTKEGFKKYSKAACPYIAITIDERKKNNDEALKKLDIYINALTKFYNEFIDSDFKTLQSSQIDRKDGFIKEVNISAVKLEKSGKEINESKNFVSFNVARWSSAYPYVSAGAIFTNFSFPEYDVRIDSGGASISNATIKKIRANPALFLNFVFNIHCDYLYPVLQVGVSTADKSILLPIGLGFSIGDRVTISGGFLPGFVKELNKFKVGDSVSGLDELNRDLSYKLTSSGYFAININLSKF